MSRSQELTRRALHYYPKTRASDRLLIVAVWTLQNPNWKSYPDRFIATDAINPETITRHRRKLQEQGEYLPDDRITEQRYEKFKLVKSGDFTIL